MRHGVQQLAYLAPDSADGMDPLRQEQAWDKLYWLLTPRGQSGYASHAMATIDLALWDLKGQILDQSVCGGPWRKRRVCPAPR